MYLSVSGSTTSVVLPSTHGKGFGAQPPSVSAVASKTATKKNDIVNHGQIFQARMIFLASGHADGL